MVRQCTQVHALKQEKLGDQCGCRLPIFKAVAPKIAQAASIEDVGIGKRFLSVLRGPRWASNQGIAEVCMPDDGVHGANTGKKRTCHRIGENQRAPEKRFFES